MLKDFQGSTGAGDPSGTAANSARSPLSRNVGGKGQTASCPSKARSDTRDAHSLLYPTQLRQGQLEQARPMGGELTGLIKWPCWSGPMPKAALGGSTHHLKLGAVSQTAPQDQLLPCPFQHLLLSTQHRGVCATARPGCAAHTQGVGLLLLDPTTSPCLVLLAS